jgi:hypothetical protein
MVEVTVFDPRLKKRCGGYIESRQVSFARSMKCIDFFRLVSEKLGYDVKSDLLTGRSLILVNGKILTDLDAHIHRDDKVELFVWGRV